LSSKHASFDASPTLADTEGLYARSPEYFYVAVEASGSVVGFITGYERKGIPEEVLHNWNASRVGYIDLMAVSVSNRRRGVGSSLLNKLLETFRANEIDMVILDVPAEQKPAVRLYEKSGFEVRAFNMRKYL